MKWKQPQRLKKINTIRCHIANTHTHTHQHMRTKDQTNIWRDAIICLLQMCRDFPRGVVNVNRISQDIITLLRRRRRRKRWRRYVDNFCSRGLSHWGDAKTASGPHTFSIQTNKNTAGGWRRNTADAWKGSRGFKVTLKVTYVFTAVAEVAESLCISAFYFTRNSNTRFFFLFLFLAPFFLRKGATEQAKQLADAQLAPQGPEEGSRKISRNAVGWKVPSNVFFFSFMSFITGYFKAGLRGRSEVRLHRATASDPEAQI